MVLEVHLKIAIRAEVLRINGKNRQKVLRMRNTFYIFVAYNRLVI